MPDGDASASYPAYRCVAVGDKRNVTGLQVRDRRPDKRSAIRQLT
ncbi:hypothetical protein BN1086_03845 [Citrobacter koseri]|uniref:Uncharacterized protein n=1 Tax=Citrobacter koseri TaxID=545 RepID=A0A078LN36_CITKO|nr:hypothetical protein BN1086_03845 [Citrobacter koseri]